MKTATKEKPIIFSAPMVKAILEGRKTQTRRVCKDAIDPALENALAVCQCRADASWIAWWGNTPQEGWQQATEIAYPNGGGFRCRYGKVGDRLWVRETWRRPHCNADTPITQGQAVAYRASWDFHDGFGDPWRSPIHMPRWASRITLEITDVRVERLQEITAKDVVAEGFPFSSDLDQFKATWRKINGNDSWIANPWVWALSFRRVETYHATQAS